MLLAIDIGNSSIDLGVFDADGKLCVTSKISSLCPRSPDEYAVLTDGILRLNHIDRSDITDCILCSVVPSLTAPVREAVTRQGRMAELAALLRRAERENKWVIHYGI